MINKLKKSKAGFTLVELIVVIAIIGVLAAVLVPQYIEYVKSAREESDKNAINEIVHAAEIASIGDGTTTVTDGTVTINIIPAGNFTYGTYGTGGTGGTGTSATLSALDGLVEDIVAPGTYIFKSDKYKGKIVTIEVTNGKAGTPSIS